LLGDGYHVTGPKNIENRSYKFGIGSRNPDGHWVLLIASKQPVNKKGWGEAQDKLRQHNEKYPNRISIPDLPTDTKDYNKKYSARGGSAIGFVLFREAKEGDNTTGNVWADKKVETKHWIVERAIPFENPIPRFGSSQSFVGLRSHSRHWGMKTKLLNMLQVDLQNGTRIKPILDSQLVDHGRQ